MKELKMNAQPKKTFAQVAQEISAIIKKPLTAEEIQKINRILTKGKNRV
jgi:hypothetical protein